MERNTPFADGHNVGAQQNPSTGDVDSNGDLIEDLTARLRAVIPAESTIPAKAQAELVAAVLVGRGLAR